MHMSSTLAAGLGAALAGVANAQYSIRNVYDASNFFDAFEFFQGEDPTHGFVEYVDANTAAAEGLAGYFSDGSVFMTVDTKTQFPEHGRRSVRLTSRDSFNHGLVIADIPHLPQGMGAWPAFWTTDHDNWPNNGEIDIIEGVNNAETNQVTLHTSGGCMINNDGTLEGTYLKNGDCAAGNSFEGCGQATQSNQNFGAGFNAEGGGVYVTEWLSDHIAVWFFPRSGIPQDITDGNPDPASWGPPLAKFNGNNGCNIDDHFKNHRLIFNITFCGDWAGQVWSSDPEASSLGGSCADYVAANPGDFSETYWQVNSVKVYSL
jgi:hypothetical protein